MPDFNQPNFRKTTTVQQPKSQMREFNVGLPEDLPEDTRQVSQQPQQLSQAEVDARIKVARQEKAEILKHGARITDHGKRRIELLANIGRLTRDVKIGDSIFSLRTLKSQEVRDATMDALSVGKNDYDVSLELRKQQLIRAIYKIDGEDINEVLGSYDISVKLELMDNLEEVAVSRLWDEFADMKKEANTKYGMTTQKATEEVVEDLKK
jgi:predicted RNA binding protein with dsRBD fold (UPF0201 family)